MPGRPGGQSQPAVRYQSHHVALGRHQEEAEPCIMQNSIQSSGESALKTSLARTGGRVWGEDVGWLVFVVVLPYRVLSRLVCPTS